ncbi:MAG: alpha/beta fold hydrolase [Acidobacteriota bacterium]|nr:MAG: alpha/beta fold hydrolase [Acidobacteriota bacterium]
MTPPISRYWRPGWKWLLVGSYLLLLLVSHAVRWSRGHEPPASGKSVISLRAVEGSRSLEQRVRFAFRDLRARQGLDAASVLLIHGSPGSSRDFGRVSPQLAAEFRVLVPDLPGFGDSSRDIPDYSIRAHAAYLDQFLAQLNADRVHVVGFSMGGGVAAELTRAAPERVASLTLLSASGVQELELLGEYRLNHLLHAVQLSGLWALHELVPHMGLLDDVMLSVPYARNFYDSDQRPLRRLLERWDGPTLILHGNHDVLVPVEAAWEHQRIVPQAKLTLFDASHFMVFTRPAMIAEAISEFVSRVESSRGVTRAETSAAMRALAAQPFDPRSVPPVHGLTLLIVFGLIVAATWVSEDLTCIGVGLMIASGRIGFVAGVLACLTGITLGDLGLFLIGKLVGAQALGRAPFKWWLDRSKVERSRRWFARRGLPVILATRFLPGSRLPTYFAAGLVGTRTRIFAAYFLLAAAVWTPLLVGLAMLAGRQAQAWFDLFQQLTLPVLLVAGAIVLALVKLGLPLSTYRGRRRIVSLWRRWTRWEFWPPWFFYPPVVFHIARLGWQVRHPTAFTAANPAIPAAGFVGESKCAILEGLDRQQGWLARFVLIDRQLSPEQKLTRLRAFMDQNGLAFPVVLKPDAGQRGADVAIIRSADEASVYFDHTPRSTMVQEYVPGDEFGIFYYRHPGESTGEIFSITEKKMPTVVGDGRRTIEELILSDERAVAMVSVYSQVNLRRLDLVPDPGQRVRLVELGTHCRGAIFLDGGWVRTPELERVIDEISRTYDGFFFGRYDIRTPAVKDFQRGRNFKIIELNGVTSEATHIYDPRLGLRAAYRTLFEQWRLAFEIGLENARRGHPTVGALSLLRMWLDYGRGS